MSCRRASSWLATAGAIAALAASAYAQDLPQSLKDRALTIRIEAVVVSPDAQKSADGGNASGGSPSAGAGGTSVGSSPAATGAAWRQESSGTTIPGTPVGVKLVSNNAVMLVQVTPFDSDRGHVTLVVQAQVWVRNGDGSLSFRTSVDKVEVAYGKAVFFYPLGKAASDKPSLRVAITVDRGGDAAANAAAGTPAAADSSTAPDSAPGANAAKGAGLPVTTGAGK
ncbi:MAG TPA: hypothetical protein VMC79_14410 [Rectinemataceae bacterium]|nr:hypothetical protein [Rectinemataceae bacterium]